MSNLATLIEQRAQIDHQIATAQHEAKAGAINQVKALMAEHGLTAHDLDGAKPAVQSRASGIKGVAIAPKYRNDKGETWTGRGLQPRWLKAALAGGATLEQFKIEA